MKKGNCVQCNNEITAQTTNGNYNVCTKPECPNYGLLQVKNEELLITNKITNPEIEELWDCLCSDLGILDNKKAKDLIREYGRRVAAQLPNIKPHKINLKKLKKAGKKAAKVFEKESRYCDACGQEGVEYPEYNICRKCL